MTPGLRKLREHLKEQPYDTFVVTDEWNRGYLSGFWNKDTLDERSGYLFVTEEKAVILTDFRYEEQAKEEADGFEQLTWEHRLTEHLSQVWDMLDSQIVAFDEQYINLRDYRAMEATLLVHKASSKMFPTRDVIEALRIIKDESEIEAIRKAMKISCKVLQTIHDNLDDYYVNGATEKVIVGECDRLHKKFGAEEIAFDPLVAFGKNVSRPHHSPGKTAMPERGPILVDIGCTINHYVSDVTRTFFVNEPLNEIKKIYKEARVAWEMMQECVKPGLTGIEVDKQVREYIEKHSSGECRHAMGHGVGIKVHEPPYLSPSYKNVLEPGMVVTWEPGVYVPGVGGARIESMLLITEDGFERLDDLGLTYDF